MKIFALETSINVLRKQYILDNKKDERELLCTHFHWLKFFLAAFPYFFITILVVIAYAMGLFMNVLPVFFGTLALTFWLLVALWKVANAFVAYRYSYLIVTTEKVIQIAHDSILKQLVNPMHLDSIISTDQASQFFGIFNCGIVVCNLTERTKYSSKQVTFNYLPNPNMVAGIIENAMVVQKHFSPSDETLPKKVVESIREKAHNIDETEPMNVYDSEIN